ELDGGSGADAHLVRAEHARHPRQVIALDWVADGATHPQWFEPDGLHVNFAGAAGLSRLIDAVWPLAAPPRSLPTPRCAAAPGPPAAGPSPPPITGVTIGASARATLVARNRELAVKAINTDAVPVFGVARLRLAAGAPLV